jgi:mRNA interferase MazF
VRGDIHRLRAPHGVRGSEQAGTRFAVVVQSDDLLLSTLLVAPTSQSAAPRDFRPTISIAGERTQILLEQTTAVAPERLGDVVGHLSRDETEQLNEALRLVLELD